MKTNILFIALLLFAFNQKVSGQPIITKQELIDSIANVYFNNTRSVSLVQSYSDNNSFTLTNNELSAITSNLIIGVAKYLGDRTKDEITSLFFEELGNYINSKEFKKYSPLFTNTINTIELLKNDLFNFKIHLPALQQAFQNDIKAIPYNFIWMVPEINGLTIEEKKYFTFIISISQRLLNGESASKVLNEINEELVTLDLINANQKGTSSGVIKLVVNGRFQVDQNMFTNYLSQSPIINAHNIDYTSSEYYSTFLSLSQIENPDNKREFYINVINVLKALPDQSESYKDFVYYFENTILSFFDIRQNNFHQGIINILNIIKYKDTVLKNSKGELNKLVKYLNFMSTIASAEKPEEITNILKNTTMPVGSYRIKRNTGSYAIINGYTGGKISFEKNLDQTQNNNTSYGLSAPIGLSFGIIKYLGGFVSLIDVGQYLSISGDNNLESFPEVTISNVFAPGAFLEFHIPKLFLTVGGGYALGPWERIDKVTSESQRYQGYQFNLKIDLPLYQIYSKP
ncbi:MAG: hypothetical protein IPN79_12845 [Saprospiraceae bacterium]|nr:hypothetical protein [Saprospiraceae bacterium]